MSEKGKKKARDATPGPGANAPAAPPGPRTVHSSPVAGDSPVEPRELLPFRTGLGRELSVVLALLGLLYTALHIASIPDAWVGWASVLGDPGKFLFHVLVLPLIVGLLCTATPPEFLATCRRTRPRRVAFYGLLLLAAASGVLGFKDAAIGYYQDTSDLERVKSAGRICYLSDLADPRVRAEVARLESCIRRDEQIRITDDGPQAQPVVLGPRSAHVLVYSSRRVITSPERDPNAASRAALTLGPPAAGAVHAEPSLRLWLGAALSALGAVGIGLVLIWAILALAFMPATASAGRTPITRALQLFVLWMVLFSFSQWRLNYGDFPIWALPQVQALGAAGIVVLVLIILVGLRAATGPIVARQVRTFCFILAGLLFQVMCASFSTVGSSMGTIARAIDSSWLTLLFLNVVAGAGAWFLATYRQASPKAPAPPPVA